MMSRGVSPPSADDVDVDDLGRLGRGIMTGPSEEHLSVREAVERYGIPVRTLTRLLRDGQLPRAYKVFAARGDEWRIPVADLQTYAMPTPSAHASEEYLSVPDAVERYGIPLGTLTRRLRNGEIAGAYKVPGPRGDEWRIRATDLETYSGRRTTGEPSPTAEPSATAAREAAAARSRAEEAERRLSVALRECAQLRAQLAQEKAHRVQAEQSAAQLISHACRPGARRCQRNGLVTEVTAPIGCHY